MPRTVEEIAADIAAAKANGVHPASKPMIALRAELKAAQGVHTEPDGRKFVSVSSDDPDNCFTNGAAPILASGDVAFINESLAQLLLKGKGAGKLEQSYSDIRSLLKVKHLLEDAAGLQPVGRINLPHWDTLGRERDTGEKFDAKTLAMARETGSSPQSVVDGTAQRAIPAAKVVARDPSAGITSRDGEPIKFSRSRTLNEPEGSASFLSEEESESVATSK